MIYSYDFSKDSLWRKDFTETYSPVCSSRNSFIQEQNCIKNSYNESLCGYDYISVAHKNVFSVGTRATLVCSFESYGAPLITLANYIGTDADGYPLYGGHYEIIVWESGCNVYFVDRAPENSEKPYVAENVLRVYFANEANNKIELSVATGKMAGFVSVLVCGHSFELPVPKLADKFFVGFTACEGINRLYSAKIEQPDE